MLDFILVRGHIPGTNIDLTFYEIIIGLPLIVGIIWFARKRPLHVKHLVIQLYVEGLHFGSVLRSKMPV